VGRKRKKKRKSGGKKGESEERDLRGCRMCCKSERYPNEVGHKVLICDPSPKKQQREDGEVTKQGSGQKRDPQFHVRVTVRQEEGRNTCQHKKGKSGGNGLSPTTDGAVLLGCRKKNRRKTLVRGKVKTRRVSIPGKCGMKNQKHLFERPRKEGGTPVFGHNITGIKTRLGDKGSLGVKRRRGQGNIKRGLGGRGAQRTTPFNQRIPMKASKTRKDQTHMQKVLVKFREPKAVGDPPEVERGHGLNPANIPTVGTVETENREIDTKRG